MRTLARGGWARAVRRAAGVSRTALAARRAARAGRAGGDEGARASARSAVAIALERESGLTAKAAQMARLLSPAVVPATAPVRASAAEPFERLRPRLEAELGGPLSRWFSEIDPAGITASLAQVHRARLRDGRQVALKLLLPGIEAAVAAELRLLGWVPEGGPLRRFGVDLAAYRALVGDQLREELDLVGEGRRLAAARAELAGIAGLVTPAPVPELSGPALLVQSWEEGEPLAAAAGWSRRERLELAYTLIAAYARSVFAAGHFHADPNPGNLLARRTGRRAELVLLDFGCTARLAPARRQALLSLLLALRRGEGAVVGPLLVDLGFCADKLAHLGDRLEEVARLLFAPWVERGPFDPARWRLQERLTELLGERRWWIRSAAPADLLFLVRATAGLVSHLSLLGVALPWWPVLESAVPAHLLAEAATSTPRAAALALLAPADARAPLRLRVWEGRQSLFDVSLPAEAAAELEHWMPPSARRRLRERGVDVARLVAGAARRGPTPTTLVDLEIDGRRYHLFEEEDPHHAHPADR